MTRAILDEAGVVAGGKPAEAAERGGRTRVARWGRVALGLFLSLHALAHALPGMRASQTASRWLDPTAAPGSDAPLAVVTLLWASATAALLAAGLGLLGARPFRERWRVLGAAGAGASMLLLVPFQPPGATLGVVLDLVVLGIVWGSFLAAPGKGEAAGGDRPGEGARGRAPRRLFSGLAVAVVAVAFLVILVRPWHMRWGSTDEELHLALPGDDLVEGPATYVIQHATTVAAPPAEVWPWLVQIGQERGGFYSYTFLEDLIGAAVENADRIVPGWQDRQEGDTVFAVPEGWLGLERRPGWRVARVDPPHVLALEGWGAFVLLPNGEEGRSTRLIVRTRGSSEPRTRDVVLAPAGLFLFEPVHFVMERAMLLGIRRRAEG